MDLVSQLGFPAIGALIALALKELLDRLKQQREYKFELNKRLFDAKLQDTIAAVRLLKTTSSNLRTHTDLISRDLAAEGTILDSKIHDSLARKFSQIDDLSKQSLGAQATLGLYYDNQVSKLAGFQNFELLSENGTTFIRCIENSVSIEEKLKTLAPKDELERGILCNLNSTHRSEMTAASHKIAQLAAQYDDQIDRLIDELRSRLKMLD